MKKKSNKRKTFVVFVVVISFIASGYYLLFYTDLFNITKVHISDNIFVSENELIEALDLKKPLNYFDVNKYIIKKNILSHPKIKAASVEVIFPNILEVSVVERIPLVAVLYSESYLLVDEDMVVVETSDDPKNYYVINGYQFSKFTVGSVFKEGNTELLKNVVDLVLFIEQSDFIIRPTISIYDNNIVLHFSSDFRAEFGDGTYMEEKFNSVRAMYLSLKKSGNLRGTINAKYKNQITLDPFGK